MKISNTLTISLTAVVITSALFTACIPGQDAAVDTQETTKESTYTIEDEKMMEEPVSESTELDDLEKELEETIIFDEDFGDL